jgi:solute carrier family 45 protein 1/2/4
MLLNARDAEATRLGSLALFYSAVLALFVNIVTPMFVASTASKHSSSMTPSHSSSVGQGGALGALGDQIGSARVGGRGGLHDDQLRGGWRSHGEGEGGWWKKIRVPERMKVKLVSLWAVSHVVLAGCLLGTL